MKKLLTVVLAIAMIASIACVAAFAEGEELNKVTIKAGDVEIAEGATEIQVPIIIEYTHDNGFAAMKINNVEIEGATFKEKVKAEGIFAYALGDGAEMLAVANIDDNANMISIPSGTTVATYTFTLAEAAKAGDEFTVVITPGTSDEFCDATEDANNLEPVVAEGKITVVAATTEAPVTTEEPTPDTSAPVSDSDTSKGDDTSKKDDDTSKKDDDKKPNPAPSTGDAAIVVVAAMIVALGTAIVVKKVNVK